MAHPLAGAARSTSHGPLHPSSNFLWFVPQSGCSSFSQHRNASNSVIPAALTITPKLVTSPRLQAWLSSPELSPQLLPLTTAKAALASCSAPGAGNTCLPLSAYLLVLRYVFNRQLLRQSYLNHSLRHSHAVVYIFHKTRCRKTLAVWFTAVFSVLSTEGGM